MLKVKRRDMAALLGGALLLLWEEKVNAQSSTPIVVFGDSLAQGTAQALTRLGYSTVNLGIKGWGLEQPDLHQRLAILQQCSKRASAVIIIIGTNDLAPIHGKEVDSQDWCNEYQKLLQKTRKSIELVNSVVWAKLPDYRREELTKHGNVVNQVITTVATVWRDRLLELPQGFEYSIRAKDGVHYTNMGYEIAAKSVLKSL